MVLIVQCLDEAAPQLWRTRVNVAPKCAVEGRFHYIHQCAGSEKRPVLSTYEEKVSVFAGVVIQADECQTQLRFVVADRRNVAVVDFAEVAFEVALNLAGKRQVLRNVRPFEVEPKARGPRLDMNFGILRRAGVEGRVRSRIQPYAGEWEVIAVGITAVVDDRSLDEAVRSKRDRARFYASEGTGLGGIDREHPDRTHRRCHRSWGRLHLTRYPRRIRWLLLGRGLRRGFRTRLGRRHRLPSHRRRRRR